MKCPQCATYRKKSFGTVCECGYRFVFTDPSLDGMTDRRFLAIVERASAHDTCYFTPNQLYAAYCDDAWKRRSAWFSVILATLVVAVPVCIFVASGQTGLVLLAAAVILVVAFFRRPAKPAPRAAWNGLLQRWIEAKGAPDKLLHKRRLIRPPPEWPEPDIYDYGFEKLLVVDEDLLVDLLVLNEFHTQERILVLAASGYPEYLKEKALAALEESPRLPAYFLHAATYQGVAKPSWLPAAVRSQMIDLGLFPEDVERMKVARRLEPTASGEFPPDLLTFNTLSILTSAALLGAVPLGQVIAERQRQAASRDSYG